MSSPETFRLRVVGALVLMLASALVASSVGVPSDTIRILPLGDSRTVGPSSRDCYRLYLDRFMTEAGYAFNFVGGLRTHGFEQNAPESTFDADHEGHWGWTTDAMVWNSWLKLGAGTWVRAAKPDIVLALVGTSDMINEGDSFSVRADRTIGDMAQLIDTLRAANPTIIILLANLYPVSPSIVKAPLPAVIDTINTRIPHLVDSMTTTRSPILFVDTWTGFDPIRDLIDGTHANRAGSTKIAKRWLEKLWPYFDTIPPPALRVASTYPHYERNKGQQPVLIVDSDVDLAAKGILGYTLMGRRVGTQLLSGKNCAVPSPFLLLSTQQTTPVLRLPVR